MQRLRHAQAILFDAETEVAPGYSAPGISYAYRMGCSSAQSETQLPVSVGGSHWFEDRLLVTSFYSGSQQGWSGSSVITLDHRFRRQRSFFAQDSLPEGLGTRGHQLLVGHQGYSVLGVPIYPGIYIHDVRTGEQLDWIDTSPLTVENFDFIDWDTIHFSTEEGHTINGEDARGLLLRLNLNTGGFSVVASIANHIEREQVQCFYVVTDRCGRSYVTVAQGVRDDGSYIESWLVCVEANGDLVWARRFPEGVNNVYSIAFNRSRTWIYAAQYGWTNAAEASYWPNFNNDKPIFKVNPADGTGMERPIATIPFRDLWGASFTSMTYPAYPNPTQRKRLVGTDWSHERMGPTDKWTDGLILLPKITARSTRAPSPSEV